MKSHVVALSLASAVALFSSPAAAAVDCRDMTIAELNWPSAGLAAWVDKLIAEAGYGCTVTLVEGDTNSAVETIVQTGKPEIVPEFWFESMSPALEEAVADKRVAFGAALLSEGGVQGWWIPKFIVDANPGITTVQQALQHPELFMPAEEGGKPAIFNCPEGWACRTSTENLFRALDADKAGFTLYDVKEAPALDESIRKAFEETKGWLGYYWAPTALLGDHPMVKLSFGVEFSKEEWDSCTIVPDCPDPKLNTYPVSAVYTLISADFVDENPELMNYFNTRSWSNGTVNEVLAWMDQEGVGNEAAARHFLAEYPDVWQAWLPEDVAAKVADKF
ncbi:glycine betaine ABC transporter substrate-binding protein [Martelella soudanensis]|uniref:glycine betaine ABC transporter substrate-binding protein n=1 Tax=unclassified Martelella TaxID=2629616 RepID=UPI0015DE4395|nr:MULTISPECIES: glycine betaine ABC transporter substrate-binding protein [unclassified Martelella]